MKKLLLSFSFLSLTILCSSQSVVLLDSTFNNVSNDTLDIYLSENSSNITEVLVKNTAVSTKTIKVLRTVINIDAMDITSFCFGGLCYGATQNLSSNTLNCTPGDTLDFNEFGFHAAFTAGPACITRLVKYKFYDLNNASDYTEVTLRYLCTTGIDEENDLTGSISDVYPNPVSSVFNISYKLNGNAQNGKIVFYDVLGKSIKEIALNSKEGVEKINRNDFESGIYFYSLINNNSVIATKKLVVSFK